MCIISFRIPSDPAGFNLKVTSMTRISRWSWKTFIDSFVHCLDYVVLVRHCINGYLKCFIKCFKMIDPYGTILNGKLIRFMFLECSTAPRNYFLFMNLSVSVLRFMLFVR